MSCRWRRESSSSFDLIQVMPQMADVIRGQFFQRHHWIVADETGRTSLRFRNAGQDVRQEAVVACP